MATSAEWVVRVLSDIYKLRSQAEHAAQQFIGTGRSLEVLGWGVSGFVFLTPDLRSAIKVHHNLDGHLTELRAYQALRQRRITSLHGLTIPRLQAFSTPGRLIQIDFVSPPFLLDFAGVKFADPGFPEETMKEIHQEIDSRFGANAPVAYAIQHALQRIGIYYLDLRPSNLNLLGLPGYVPPKEDDD